MASRFVRRLKKLAKQPSTYRGLALLLTAFGIYVDPVAISTIGAGIVAAIGLYDSTRDERPEDLD